MRKIVTIILIISMILSVATFVNAEEANCIDAANSSFEGVTDVKNTKWYKFTDTSGDTKLSDKNFNNIEIKTTGGYSGSNYLSMTAKESWVSPSINIFPFIKESGAGTYVLTFRYKASSTLKLKQLCIRGLEADVETTAGLDFAITHQGNGNKYLYLNGSTSETADKGWFLFTSRAFTIDASQLKSNHNWWFTIDNTPATSTSPFTFDIDDFAITKSTSAATPTPTTAPIATPKPNAVIKDVVTYDDNLVTAIDSSFEGNTAINKTKWYKLTDAYGSSKGASYNRIEIKGDGGHTGTNYLSTYCSQSWHSPSINIHPFLKASGENTYVISFWYKSDASLNISRFVIRGLESDSIESKDYDISIVPKGSGNFYGELAGSTTTIDGSDWKCFVSDPFELSADQITDDFNWWFCLDQLPAPITIDIDDFIIVPESSFEYPEEEIEDELKTDITYLTDEVKNNVIAKYTPSANATPAPDAQTPADDNANTAKETANYTATIIISSAVFVVAFTGSFFTVKAFKKKK
jgi:hypothetical protein